MSLDSVYTGGLVVDSVSSEWFTCTLYLAVYYFVICVTFSVNVTHFRCVLCREVSGCVVVFARGVGVVV